MIAFQLKSGSQPYSARTSDDEAEAEAERDERRRVRRGTNRVRESDG